MDKHQELLNQIYYDIKSPGSFGGSKRLFKAAKNRDSTINYDQVKEWLKGQEAYTNFRAPRKKFSRLPILVDRIDEQWQMDLMDMSYWKRNNNRYRYLIVCIDCLSRYSWVRPIKDKGANTIINALESILRTKRKPEKLQTDQGKEFKNNTFTRFCRNNGIHHFTTTDPTIKCALAERFIRTLRARIYRFIYWKNTHRYIDDLQSIVDNYNNSYHRTIKTSPGQVNQRNQQSIVRTIQRSIKNNTDKKQIFNINDHVKIPLIHNSLDKSALQQWTDEVFKVRSVKETPEKYIYKLEDLTGENITSIFYPEELQKVAYNPNLPRRIERVLQRSYDRQRRQYKYLVRWEGWPSKFDSWVWQLENTSRKNGRS